MLVAGAHVTAPTMHNLCDRFAIIRIQRLLAQPEVYYYFNIVLALSDMVVQTINLVQYFY